MNAERVGDWLRAACWLLWGSAAIVVIVAQFDMTQAVRDASDQASWAECASNWPGSLR